MESLKILIFFLVYGFSIGLKLLFVNSFPVLKSLCEIIVYRVSDCL